MKKLLYLLIFIWSLIWSFPQNIVGLVFLVLHIIHDEKVEITFHKFTVIVYTSITKYVHAGVSFGPFIIINRNFASKIKNVYNRDVEVHEFGHSVHNLFMGILYLPAVGLVSYNRSRYWTKHKLQYEDYFNGYPEDLADKLGKKFF